MTDPERRLIDLGARLAYPPTPGLAAEVEARLAAAPAKRPRRAARALVIAFAALFLVAAGTALAVPEWREFIFEKLGLRGATIERVVTLPPVPAEADLALGEEMTLEEAAGEVSFEVLVPALLGEPDQVYVDASTPGGRVTLAYREDGRIAALVAEFRSDLEPDLLGKLVQGEGAKTASVGGAPALWAVGPHVVFYRDAEGEIREETLRLATNTLLWERGALLLRLESGLAREEAVRVARSAQPPASR